MEQMRSIILLQLDGSMQLHHVWVCMTDLPILQLLKTLMPIKLINHGSDENPLVEHQHLHQLQVIPPHIPLHFNELCKNHHRRRSTSANPNIAPTLSLPATPITKYYHHPQRFLQTSSQHPPPSIELCKLHIMGLLLERVQAAIFALAKLSLHSKPANPF